MAIVRCVECDGNISTRAETCPHCGYPAENYPSIAQSWGILGIMIGTALFVVPALIFAPLLFGLDFNDMSFGAQILITTLLLSLIHI